MAVVGRLPRRHEWLGLRPSGAGYLMVVGRGDLVLGEVPAEPDDVLLASIAYFEDALEPPPSRIEATQADIAAAVRWVAAAERSAGRHRRLEEAIDAIDDGLAADEVSGRLRAAVDPMTADGPMARLRARLAAVQLLG
jgi:hypothetical protein